MTTGDDNSRRIEDFLKLNEVIFENRQFEASYHVLAAAFHLAKDAREIYLLNRISELARQQSAWIDAHAPEHPLSAYSKAARPYGVLVYHGLAQIARAYAVMLTQNRAEH